MSARSNLIDGLKILEQYDPEGDMCAHHDVLVGAPPDVEISEDEAKQLRNLGWIFVEDEGWSYYT